jgi:hypothetical protein
MWELPTTKNDSVGTLRRIRIVFAHVSRLSLRIMNGGENGQHFRVGLGQLDSNFTPRNGHPVPQVDIRYAQAESQQADVKF